jgi:hypothetical protein
MLVDGRVVVGLELFSKQLVEGIMAAVAKEGNGQTDHYDELCICEVPSPFSQSGRCLGSLLLDRMERLRSQGGLATCVA